MAIPPPSSLQINLKSFIGDKPIPHQSSRSFKGMLITLRTSQYLSLDAFSLFSYNPSGVYYYGFIYFTTGLSLEKETMLDKTEYKAPNCSICANEATGPQRTQSASQSLELWMIKWTDWGLFCYICSMLSDNWS